jgi:4-hydroxythreonine-4-phosphate dehydrogenase
MPVDKKPIAITIGDASGIGPEIIVNAFYKAPEQFHNCIVVGDKAVMQRAWQVVAAKTRPLPMNMPMQEGLSIQQVGGPLAQEQLPAFGKISAVAGKLAADSITWATQAALRGEVSAIVTAPLHKEALSLAGFKFPGHTEMLQALAAQHLNKTIAELPVRMMLANRELKTVLVTIHQPLRQAIDAVTVDRILETLRITHRAELASTGRAPHLAVAGLNPHAGEGGLFGDEERSIIGPAIAAARERGCDASGPWPPDTVFMQARATGANARFDVVIAMYHDQGLIPVKYLGVEQGVNLTLGLPFVRTSPDHGTAFDIAGQGQADASSLLAAVRMARQWVRPAQG